MLLKLCVLCLLYDAPNIFLTTGGNSLSETIPTELGELTSLEELYFWGNSLNGTIPKEFEMLTSLTDLDFGK
jgi:hypothetical protein